MPDLRLITCHSSFGWMGIVISPFGLRKLILFQQSKDYVVDKAGRTCSVNNNSDLVQFKDLLKSLHRYLEGKPVDFPGKLDLSEATRFQQAVWEITRSIRFGQTRSYGWVAAQLGKPQAMRAVGQALGRNSVPIIIPCHRVISSDGGLGGFSDGLEMKKLLLRLEKDGYVI